MTEAALQSTPALAVYGAALTAIVFWGLTPAMTKFVVAEVDPFTVGILRTVVAGPICLVVVGHRIVIAEDRIGLALDGFLVLGYIGFPVLFTLGQAETKTSHAALIIAIMPVLTDCLRRLPNAACRSEDGGSDRRRLSPELPSWSARVSALVAAATVGCDWLRLAAAICGSAGYIAGVG